MNALIADVIGEVALVLVVSWLFGLAARRCGQPIVVGQIVAGILLGPTLLGRLPGHLTGRLFPPAELKVLNVLAQIAVVLFMFVVGTNLTGGQCKEDAGSWCSSRLAHCSCRWRSDPV